MLANILRPRAGTVTAALEADVLRLHVRDARPPLERIVRRVEAHAAAVFGETLDRA